MLSIYVLSSPVMIQLLIVGWIYSKSVYLIDKLLGIGQAVRRTALTRGSLVRTQYSQLIVLANVFVGRSDMTYSPLDFVSYQIYLAGNEFSRL